MSKTEICGLQRLTLLDFPGRTACTVFTGGCDLRCPFCHNASLVRGEAEPLERGEAEEYIRRRAGILEGVCVTGGEPLMQPDLAEFLRFVRSLGLAAKLDTNGTFPRRLKALLDEGLLDYVAMDLKNSPPLYAKTVGREAFDFAPVAESMELLRASGVEYEYRTTVVKGLHTAESLADAAALLRAGERWFLQQFSDSGDILSAGCEAFSSDEMRFLRDAAAKVFPGVKLRGV